MPAGSATAGCSSRRSGSRCSAPSPYRRHLDRRRDDRALQGVAPPRAAPHRDGTEDSARLVLLSAPILWPRWIPPRSPRRARPSPTEPPSISCSIRLWRATSTRPGSGHKRPRASAAAGRVGEGGRGAASRVAAHHAALAGRGVAAGPGPEVSGASDVGAAGDAGVTCSTGAVTRTGAAH
jgi:hypothetical protein